MWALGKVSHISSSGRSLEGWVFDTSLKSPYKTKHLLWLKELWLPSGLAGANYGYGVGWNLSMARNRGWWRPVCLNWPKLQGGGRGGCVCFSPGRRFISLSPIPFVAAQTSLIYQALKYRFPNLSLMCVLCQTLSSLNSLWRINSEPHSTPLQPF